MGHGIKKKKEDNDKNQCKPEENIITRGGFLNAKVGKEQEREMDVGHATDVNLSE